MLAGLRSDSCPVVDPPPTLRSSVLVAVAGRRENEEPEAPPTVRESSPDWSVYVDDADVPTQRGR